jgi:hypothetical protein
MRLQYGYNDSTALLTERRRSTDLAPLFAPLAATGMVDVGMGIPDYIL